MNDLSEKLRTHIETVQGKEAVFGIDDCSPWADMWQAQFTGERVVPEPEWRSWDDVERMIRDKGSLCALWDEALIGKPLCETGFPEFGDVGIVNTRVAGQVSGIFLDHGRFVWRVKNGVAYMAPREIIKAWTFSR